jgi:hypothetical protein
MKNSMVNYKGKQVDFETLPKNEQAFRWALFIDSEGYEKNVSKKRIKEIASEYGVTIEK